MNKKEGSAVLGILIVLALAAPLPAAAQERLYVGASLGSAKSKNTCEGIIGTCDDQDTAYKLFGGYEFNRNVAVEAGYGYLGDVTATGTFQGQPLDFEVTNKALDVSAIFTAPFSERFAIFGRLGVYRSQVELRGSLGPLQGGDQNSAFTWGAGVRIGFGRALAVRAEWQHYPNIGGSNAGVDDIDYMSLGLILGF